MKANDQAGASRGLRLTGMGAVSGAGLTLPETCAAIRSGISAIHESIEFEVPDEQGHLEPALCAEAIGLTTGQRRYRRLLAMSVAALREALESGGLDGQSCEEAKLYLCLQETNRPGMDNRAAERLSTDIESICGVAFGDSKVYSNGHAGIFAAIAQAEAELREGSFRFAVVGGVDSYLDDITLAWLFDEKRVKTPSSSKGFLPGEAAAFLVLERHQAAEARGQKAFAQISSAAIATEASNYYSGEPTAGQGLSKVISLTIQAEGVAEPGIESILGDLNGERGRSIEWGMALPRVPEATGNNAALVHTSESIGDCGAASGAVNICYSAWAASIGLKRFSKSLVWGASDDGERGSALVSTVSN